MPVDARGPAGDLRVLVCFQLSVAECNLSDSRKWLLVSSNTGKQDRLQLGSLSSAFLLGSEVKAKMLKE